MGCLGLIDFTQVSVRNYFADLSSRITSTSQGTLNQLSSTELRRVLPGCR